MAVIVTGGTGFIGRELTKTLDDLQVEVRAPIRVKNLTPTKFITYYPFNELFGNSAIFDGVDTFIHTAGLAHGKCTDENEFERVNVDLSVRLARAAAQHGVKRFIYISSVAVYGSSGEQFNIEHRACPVDTQASSKLHAENALRKIANELGLEYVIIRPPLVYGKGAPGNMGSLQKIAKSCRVLPFGSVRNSRSFVSTFNLVDLIIKCMLHPNAANQTFLVSDGDDISSSDLLRKFITASGRKPILLPIPVVLLEIVASCLGKKAMIERFTSSFSVDIHHTRETLGWKPPMTLDEGIQRCFK
ncbi:NAD-dependent epimerase/dehydratase family protein [Pseudoalteromonas piscicida]